MNFAAVFAELLPHSELAAAERCGVNLAQDLIDRWSQCFFLIINLDASSLRQLCHNWSVHPKLDFFTQLNATVTGVNHKS